MAHTHSHPSSPGNDNAKRLMLAFGVTATFMVIEVIGGLVSGSLALLADAGHMLTDAAALLRPAGGAVCSPPTQRASYLRLAEADHPCRVC